MFLHGNHSLLNIYDAISIFMFIMLDFGANHWRVDAVRKIKSIKCLIWLWKRSLTSYEHEEKGNRCLLIFCLDSSFTFGPKCLLTIWFLLGIGTFDGEKRLRQDQHALHYLRQLHRTRHSTSWSYKYVSCNPNGNCPTMDNSSSIFIEFNPLNFECFPSSSWRWTLSCEVFGQFR